MSILILFGLSFSTSYAKAETIHMYVQNMPQQWQDQFDGVLSKATQYWENKIPGLKFDTASSVDKSDFVVEWASQYGERKLGHYSTDTANAYGKPTLEITFGFIKDKEWHLISSDQVLQITKHELGHAIGLPYSDAPNDIMYPTIEDCESWQQNSEQDLQFSIDTSIDWQSRSDKYQKLTSDKIFPLASKIDETKSLLNSTSYDSQAAKYALDDAWTAFWWAKKYLDSADKIQTDGGTHVLQSNYHDSYIEFKSSYDFAKKVEQKLTQITEYIEKANNLEYSGN
jgi:hypothetical protein